MGINRSRGLPGQDMMMGTLDYARAVQKAGGIPVALPVIEDEETIEALARRLDGFLFSGGPDINPQRYHEAFQRGMGLVVPERDVFEFTLLEKVLIKNKPILGICRGFQLINVFFGGTLHQDIYETKITNLEHVANMAPKYNPCHSVRLSKESKIFRAFEKDQLWVNSFHHQAVKRIGKGLVESAWSEDGLIEAFEHQEHAFVVGVQWHPEMMVEVHHEQLAVFQMFINAAENTAKNHGVNQ